MRLPDALLAMHCCPAWSCRLCIGLRTPALPILDMAGDGIADMQTPCGLSSMVLLSCMLRPLYAEAIPTSMVRPDVRTVCCCCTGLLKGPASIVLKGSCCCMAMEQKGAAEGRLLLPAGSISAMTAVLSKPGMCCR
jgi:hypothetical protein